MIDQGLNSLSRFMQIEIPLIQKKSFHYMQKKKKKKKKKEFSLTMNFDSFGSHRRLSSDSNLDLVVTLDLDCLSLDRFLGQTKTGRCCLDCMPPDPGSWRVETAILTCLILWLFSLSTIFAPSQPLPWLALAIWYVTVILFKRVLNDSMRIKTVTASDSFLDMIKRIRSL